MISRSWALGLNFPDLIPEYIQSTSAEHKIAPDKTKKYFSIARMLANFIPDCSMSHVFNWTFPICEIP